MTKKVATTVVKTRSKKVASAQRSKISREITKKKTSSAKTKTTKRSSPTLTSSITKAKKRVLKNGAIQEKEKPLTFQSVLQNSIYKNRGVLYDIVPPNGFLHRIKQKNALILELAPILMNSSVPTVFVYGSPGTGKTGILHELMAQLQTEAHKQSVEVSPMYVNCSENRSTTVILVELLNLAHPDKEFPKVGWSRAKAVDEFTKLLNKEKRNYLIIMDEVDYVLRNEGDDLLYLFSRINSKVESNVSIILISNDMKVQEYLKPRTQSSLGRIRVIFSPYNEAELFDILHDRATLAFDSGVVSDEVLMEVAEIEAHRQGDARRALELLDFCAKIAIIEKKKKITLDFVDKADHMVEQDSILKTIVSFTKHQRILYLSMLKSSAKELLSSSVYANYMAECHSYDIVPLSERSVRTFLVEFDNLGLIETEVGWLKSIKKKTKKITLNLDQSIRNKIRKTLRDNI